MEAIKIEDLKPDMLVMDNVVHRSTGVVLIYQGAVLTDNLILFLCRVAKNGYCLVGESPLDVPKKFS